LACAIDSFGVCDFDRLRFERDVLLERARLAAPASRCARDCVSSRSEMLAVRASVVLR
jgi:hypothetical protein